MRSLSLFAASLALAGSVLLAPSAQAANISLMAGRSFTTHEIRWTNVAFASISPQVEQNGIHFEPVATLGWIQARSSHKDNLHHTVYIGGAGIRLANFWQNAFASFQLGVAAGRTDAISSAGQFITTLGWQGNHWLIAARHISNGHLFHGRNLGETMLLAGVRF